MSIQPHKLSISRYGAALLSVAVATGLKLLIGTVTDIQGPYLIYFATVLFSAWYGGKGPGLLAVGLSALCSDYFFLDPVYTLFRHSAGEALRLGLFIVEGGLMTWIIAALHTAKHQSDSRLRSLQESERRCRKLVDSNIFGIAVGDFGGNLHDANDYFLDLIGHNRQELQAGQIRWEQLIPDEFLQPDHPVAQELKSKGICTPFEKEYICSDGSSVPVLIGGALLENDAPQQAEFVVFVLNIRQRKQVEEERNQLLLREQQARREVELQRGYLYGLLMQAPAHICFTQGSEHVFEFANIQYRQLVGDRELIGSPIRQVFPELAEQNIFELMDHVLATGEGYIGREVGVQLHSQTNAEAETRFFNFVYQPMYDLGGAVSGVMTFAFEVTDHMLSRQQTEVLAKYSRSQQKALKASEARYRSLIEATAQIIWSTAPDGEITSEQPGWQAFTGQSCEEMRGLGWLNAVHPDDRGRTAENWAIAIANQTPYEIEHRLRRHDGTYRYMSARAVPVLESDETVREWIGAHSDITDRKQVEAEREQLLVREQAAREEAEVANRVKDEFLATLSHELRTPLNAILGWVQLLQTRRFDSATSSRALETIDRNARSLAQLIDDVLDVSRIVTGKLHLRVEPVDLQAVIEAAIETVRPAIAAKEIQLIFDPQQPVGCVSGDSDRLRQVVWNLLSNAIKFTDERGRVKVKLLSNKGQVQICICDTGQGISPEFLPYVFDRFRQADGSITRVHGGLGLGLSIVRHLVELHGGTVEADSQGLGRGATFTVSLPLLTEGVVSAAKEAKEA